MFLAANPLIPTVSHHKRAIFGPKLFEELAGSDGLNSCIDRIRPFAFGPEGRPAPTHRINPQVVMLVMENVHPSTGGDVVAGDGLIVITADDQSVGAQHLQIICNA